MDWNIYGLDFGLDWNTVLDLLFNENFECWINELGVGLTVGADMHVCSF